MDPADRQAYVDRYEARLREHGHAPATLGWGKGGREHVRFGVMAAVIEEVGAESVLDVGCGFADLHDHLRAHGWEGDYRGIDLVPGLIDEALRRDPSLPVEVADIADFAPGDGAGFDVVVASGIFNAELAAESNEQHIERAVRRMFGLCRSAVCVDFMSTWVDFTHPGAWHTDPVWALALGRGLSKRVKLRHDYMPFEFALTIYRDDAHPDNVFAPHGEAGR